MSEFVTNDDMFGKYCKIPTGCSRMEHIYKIVKRIESNTYCDVPLYSGQTEEITHKDSVQVLLVIHCGVYESEVVRVPLAACKICAAPSGWISVKDRLPEDGKCVLCWYEYFRYSGYNRMFKTYGIGYQYNGSWGGEVSNGTKAKVLAWRELPDPPRLEEIKE